MYKRNKVDKTTLNVNQCYIAESLEKTIKRQLANKEPHDASSPTIYTERKHGVLPEYNPRTDRWEIAIDAQEKASKQHIAKREDAIKKRDEAQKPKKDGGAEPIQATDNK